MVEMRVSSASILEGRRTNCDAILAQGKGLGLMGDKTTRA
jgi:hypothetical protein